MTGRNTVFRGCKRSARVSHFRGCTSPTRLISDFKVTAIGWRRYQNSRFAEKPHDCFQAWKNNTAPSNPFSAKSHPGLIIMTVVAITEGVCMPG